MSAIHLIKESYGHVILSTIKGTRLIPSKGLRETSIDFFQVREEVEREERDLDSNVKGFQVELKRWRDYRSVGV